MKDLEPLGERKPDVRIAIGSLARAGSERVCTLLCNHWAALGLTVELVVVRRTDDAEFAVDERVVQHRGEFTRVRQAIPWVRTKANRWSDVPVIVFGFECGSVFGLLDRLGLLHAPWVYREGSCPYLNVPWQARWRYRSLIGQANAAIAQSHFALVALRRLGAARGGAHVIGNPSAGFGMMTRARPACQGFSLNMVCVGRLSREKGFRRMIEAFPLIAARFPAARLDIAGDGPQRAELQQLIIDCHLESRVSMVGHVTDIPELLSRSDLLILPSFYEGQPNAVVEALGAGCRVVAAGGLGVRELLSELGIRSCWVPEADFSNQLTAAVVRSVELSDEVWSSAQLLLQERADIDVIASAYLAVCNGLAQSRSP